MDASFTVEGQANPAEHVVAYGATVDLALVSPTQTGLSSIHWSIPGTSLSTEEAPTITPAGNPSGATASFAMPSDPSDIYGRSFRVRCLVRGHDGSSAEQFAIVGAVNARGILPMPLGELGPLNEDEDGEDRDGERHATHGYTDVLNRVAIFSGGFTPSAPQLHTTLHSPVGLYQFNETLNDTSGGGLHLSLVAGNTRYTEIVPGLRALKVSTAEKFRHAATGTALAIAGDVTIMMLIMVDSYANGGIVSYDTGAETQAGNVQYAVAFISQDLQWFHESGAGVDRVFSPNRLPPLFELCHLAARRQSNVIQFFINGRQFGAASSALTAPDGGSSSRLYLGYEANDTASYSIASLKIVASALTDAEIEAEHDRTLGPWHGQR